MTVTLQQVKYPYLVAVIGVVLMAITWAFGEVRGMMYREAFRPGGGLGGTRQFGNAAPFAFTNVLAILAVIIAVVGLVWLGLALRRTPKSPAS